MRSDYAVGRQGSSWLATSPEGLPGPRRLANVDDSGQWAPHPAPPAVQVEGLGDGRFFIAASPAMRKVRQQAAKVAPVNLPVLLVGEPGTGRGIVARLIHDLSPRKGGPFKKLRCSHVREDDLERELFGFEWQDAMGRGRWQPGLLEMCHRGTLHLDAITDMPWRLQARLVDVLDNGGHFKPREGLDQPADVRFVVSADADPAQAVESGKLRQDLFYRLHCLILRLPPLRERKEDTGALLHHWITRTSPVWRRPTSGVVEALEQACLRYTWPGNFWEFEDFVERYLRPGQVPLALMCLKEKARRSA